MSCIKTQFFSNPLMQSGDKKKKNEVAVCGNLILFERHSINFKCKKLCSCHNSGMNQAGFKKIFITGQQHINICI